MGDDIVVVLFLKTNEHHRHSVMLAADFDDDFDLDDIADQANAIFERI